MGNAENRVSVEVSGEEEAERVYVDVQVVDCSWQQLLPAELKMLVPVESASVITAEILKGCLRVRLVGFGQEGFFSIGVQRWHLSQPSEGVDPGFAELALVGSLKGEGDGKR